MSNASDRYVLLRGGLAVPVEPLLLVLDLETRGFGLHSDGGDIVVSPASRLSDRDRRALRRWKFHVLALLTYEPPHVQ